MATVEGNSKPPRFPGQFVTSARVAFLKLFWHEEQVKALIVKQHKMFFLDTILTSKIRCLNHESCKTIFNSHFLPQSERTTVVMHSLLWRFLRAMWVVSLSPKEIKTSKYWFNHSTKFLKVSAEHICLFSTPSSDGWYFAELLILGNGQCLICTPTSVKPAG